MKTVFFTLYQTHVFRNVFLQEGSVLDRLSRDDRLKLVIVTSPGIAEVISRDHRSKIGGRTAVEVIKIRRPQKFLERLFYFFYSYLIFTGTTKMLATYGVRVDAPPAGGNMALAFLKRAIAGTFGRFRWIKTRLTPWLFFKIFSERPYQSTFERHKPDLVFISSIAEFPDIEMLAEAKKRGIKTLGMAANWDHLNKYFIPLQSDLLLVQNEPMAKEAVALQGYRAGQVKLVGFPQFDLYGSLKDYTDPRKVFLRRLSLPEDAKLIYFITGAAHYLGEPDIVRETLRWLQENSLGAKSFLMIRTYPGTTQERFREFYGHSRIVFDHPPALLTFEALRHFFNQMRHADVVISIYSTTAIEAGILDKPLIAIGFDGHAELPFMKSIRRAETMTHIRHILDTGSVRVVRSFDELFYDLKRYLGAPEIDREKRKQLVQKMCYKIDGAASERIANFILEEISSQAAI